MKISVNTRKIQSSLNGLYRNWPRYTHFRKPWLIVPRFIFAKTFLNKKITFGYKYYRVMKEKIFFSA